MNAVFFQVQSEIIVGLFGIDWLRTSLSKKVDHPALRRFCLSQQIVRNNGVIIRPFRTLFRYSFRRVLGCVLRQIAEKVGYFTAV